MTYTKQSWVNGAAGGTPVSAARLAYMEEGIENATIADGTFIRVVEGPLSLNDTRVNADLTGATDSTAAITTAFGLLPATGGEIFQPPGLVKANIDLTTVGIAAKVGGMKWAGTGNRSVLEAWNPALPVVKGIFDSGTVKRGLKWQDLIVVGSGSNTAGHGFDLDYIYDSRFYNVWVQNVGGNAFHLRHCVGLDFYSPRIVTPNGDGFNTASACNALNLYGGRLSGKASGTPRGLTFSNASARLGIYGTVIESFYIGVYLAELGTVQASEIHGYFENNLRSDIYMGGYAIDGVEVSNCEAYGNSLAAQFIEFDGAGTFNAVRSHGNRSIGHTTRTYSIFGTLTNCEFGPDAATDPAYSNASLIARSAMQAAVANDPYHIEIAPWAGSVSQVNWNTVNHNDITLGGRFVSSTGAIDAEINFDVVLSAGTWRLDALGLKGTDRGIITWSLDGTDVGTTDTYADPFAYNQAMSVTGIVVAATGKKRLRAKVSTKHASSSGYSASLAHIQLKRTA